jgi:hypothetical protein
LVDEGTTVADRGDRTRDGFLLLQQIGRDVEVEALGSDDRAASSWRRSPITTTSRVWP